MDKRTMAGDSVITIIGLILSTYAGSRMMTQAAWECNNPNFGYYATPPEVKDCISRPEGLMRRFCLAALMTSPAIILVMNCLGHLLTQSLSRGSRIVRGLSICGSLAGVTMIVCQLSGVFWEDKCFFCQTQTYGLAALPDIRSYECYTRSEEGFDAMMFCECVVLVILAVWNVVCMVRGGGDSQGSGGGGDKLGQAGQNKCCWGKKKNSQDAETGLAAGGDEKAIYTSDSRGSDEAGEGTYEVPFKTVTKAIKTAAAGKEPFPPIYVDVKPDSVAARSGAKYELIAKAQLKKITKEQQQETKRHKTVRTLAAKAALSRAPAAKDISQAGPTEELRRELAAANIKINELQAERERREYVDKIRRALASEENGDKIILEGTLVDIFSAKKDKNGVVRRSEFPAMMNKLLVTPKKHGLPVPEPGQYMAIFRRHDQSGYGRLTVDEWMELASEEVFKKFL